MPDIRNSFIATVANAKALHYMKAVDAVKWYIGHRAVNGDSDLVEQAILNRDYLADEYMIWIKKNVPDSGYKRGSFSTTKTLKIAKKQREAEEDIGYKLNQMF